MYKSIFILQRISQRAAVILTLLYLNLTHYYFILLYLNLTNGTIVDMNFYQDVLHIPQYSILIVLIVVHVFG